MIDIDKLQDKVEQDAKWNIVRSFGQTPKRLLQRPHAARLQRSDGRPFFSVAQPPEVVWHRGFSYPVHSVHITRAGEVHALGPCKACFFCC